MQFTFDWLGVFGFWFRLGIWFVLLCVGDLVLVPQICWFRVGVGFVCLVLGFAGHVLLF